MRFLYNAPAILHKGALILGDTHFGIEKRLRQRGISANDFSMRIAEKIIALAEGNKAKRLILLGDVKEDIAYMDAFAREAIEALLGSGLQLTIVRGNHDGGIEEFGNRIELIPPEGFVYSGLGLIHGHSWPSEECMQADYLIAAHQHPHMRFMDRSGKKHIEPVWLVAEPDRDNIAAHFEKFNRKIRLVMMPAFNPLVGTVIKTDVFSVLGPLLNNKLFKWNDALVFRLNGVAVGKLSDIEVTR